MMSMICLRILKPFKANLEKMKQQDYITDAQYKEAMSQLGN